VSIQLELEDMAEHLDELFELLPQETFERGKATSFEQLIDTVKIRELSA
jgi:hypothetical protein